MVDDIPRDGDARYYIEVIFTDSAQARDIFHTLERMLEGTGGFEAILLRNRPDTRDAALRKALKLSLADFYSPAEAEAWLESEQPMLGGLSPAAAIAEGRAGDVIAIIAQLREGAYI